MKHHSVHALSDSKVTCFSLFVVLTITTITAGGCKKLVIRGQIKSEGSPFPPAVSQGLITPWLCAALTYLMTSRELTLIANWGHCDPHQHHMPLRINNHPWEITNLTVKIQNGSAAASPLGHSHLRRLNRGQKRAIESKALTLPKSLSKSLRRN